MVALDNVPGAQWLISRQPFKHQETAFHTAVHVLNLNGLGALKSGGRGFGFLMEMGTGKTLACIATMSYAFMQRRANRFLIVAPNSVVPVWPDELKNAGLVHPYQCEVLDGPGVHRAETLNLWRRNPDVMQVAVINYESTWRIDAALRRFKPEFIVCDESQRIKNSGAKQSKTMWALGKLAKYRVILTGSLVSQSEWDVYSQYKFLDPSVFGTSKTLFGARYLNLDSIFPSKVLSLKDGAEFTQKIHSIAYRITKEQARLNLPEFSDVVKYCELEDATARVYQKVAKESVAELAKDGPKITAANVLTKMLRLQQITGGFVNDDDGALTNISTAKINLLEDELEGLYANPDNKSVIFARFLPEIRAIQDLHTRRGWDYRKIDGSVPQDARGRFVSEFQSDRGIRTMVAQGQTAGLGITLTAANTAFFYSPDFSFSNYDQSRARIHRIGQKNACLYVHLCARGTIDTYILNVLSKKKSVADNIMDNWREVFLGQVKAA